MATDSINLYNLCNNGGHGQLRSSDAQAHERIVCQCFAASALLTNLLANIAGLSSLISGGRILRTCFNLGIRSPYFFHKRGKDWLYCLCRRQQSSIEDPAQSL